MEQLSKIVPPAPLGRRTRSDRTNPAPSLPVSGIAQQGPTRTPRTAAEKSRRYREKYPEKARAASRARYWRNRERYLAWWQQYYAANREEICWKQKLRRCGIK